MKIHFMSCKSLLWFHGVPRIHKTRGRSIVVPMEMYSCQALPEKENKLKKEK